MRWNSYDNWRPYVPVAERRRRAARKVAKMKKVGRVVSPVEIAGRKIAMTFWGDAWCKNLEAYSDYSNRLPRGRTYVRNGSVVDLQISSASVHALVSGSELYEVDIQIKRLTKKRWTDIKGQCAGKIDSLVELLQGSISRGVMEVVTRTGKGLFPAPREISLQCSCPDWATMCKHVAATLYGVGARLDHTPELLFTLRGVDPAEMVEVAVGRPSTGGRARRGRVLESGELSAVFGVEIAVEGAMDATDTRPSRRRRRAVPARRKTGQRSVVARKPAAKKPSVRARAASRSAATKKKRVTVMSSAARSASGRVRSQAKKIAPRRAAPKRKTTTRKSATRKVGSKAVARKASTGKVRVTTKKAAAMQKSASAPSRAKMKATDKLVARKKKPTSRRSVLRRAHRKAATRKISPESQAASKNRSARSGQRTTRASKKVVSGRASG